MSDYAIAPSDCLVPSRPAPSRPLPSRPTPSRPVLSRPVPSRPVPPVCRLVDDADRAWLMEHLRVVAKENLEDDMDQLFSRLDSDADGKVGWVLPGRELGIKAQKSYRHTGLMCTTLTLTLTLTVLGS